MSRERAAGVGWPVLLAAILLAGGPLAADQKGWQVDLGYGRSSLEEVFGKRHVKRFEDHDGALSVEVGYFFNEYVGVQVGYHDFGSFGGVGSPCPDDVDACIERLTGQTFELCVEGSPCTEVLALMQADVTGWSLAVVPSWPFTRRLAAFARLGALEWDAELSTGWIVTGRGRGFESFSDTDLLTGIGLSYRFGKNLGAVAEYRRLDIDLASASLGVNWRF